MSMLSGVLEAKDARIAELQAENERLRAVLRQTCVNECGPEYRGRGLHAPGCLAYEVDEAAP